MLDTIAPPSALPAQGLARRVIGVLTAPRATYANVAAHPRWLGVLLVVLLVTIVASAAFFSTEVGQQAMLDRQIRTAESFGRSVSDAQYQQLQRFAPYAPYFTAASQVFLLPLSALIIAGLAFAIFSAALGGNAAFKQVFAVVSHSGLIVTLQQLFSLPLDYARQTVSSPTNLAVFLPFLDENTFLARLLGSIDLFLVWWIVSLSIGLGVLYKRRTGPIATGILIVYAVIALVLAAIRTALSAT